MTHNGGAATLKLLATLAMGLEVYAARLPDGSEKQAYDEVLAILSRAMKQEIDKEGVWDGFLAMTASPKYA